MTATTASVVAFETMPATANDFWGAMRRRKYFAALAFVLTICAGAALSARQPRLYEATALVLVARGDVADQLAGTTTSLGPQDFDQYLQTQAVLARSPVVVRRALTRVGAGVSSTTQRLLDDSTVAPGVRTDLLSFTVKYRTPEGAQRLANAYAQAFTTYSRTLATASILTATLNLQRRISNLRQQPKAQVTDSVLADLLSKLEQLRTIDALQSSKATIARTASSAGQVQPRTTRNLAAAVLIAIGVAVAVALLIDGLDSRVRSIDEIEAALGVPLVGAFPRPGITDPISPGVNDLEILRVVRTSLQLRAIGREFKTLTITSPFPREGKSTTAAALAGSFANAGLRVILLEMDLRRPSLDSLMALGKPPGLLQVLLGTVAVRDALVSVALPTSGDAALRMGGSLRVLAAGGTPPNPAELVNSPRLERIIEELRGESDLLVIDTPPLLGFGETPQLMAFADATLAVMRLGRLNRPGLKEFAQAVERTPTMLAGLVVTNTPKTDSPIYGYTYGYVPASDVAAGRA